MDRVIKFVKLLRDSLPANFKSYAYGLGFLFFLYKLKDWSYNGSQESVIDLKLDIKEGRGDEAFQALSKYSNKAWMVNNGNLLLEAVKTGDLELVRNISLIPGVDVNAKTFWTSNTPLEEAASRGNVEIVKLLLNHPEIDLSAPKDRALEVSTKHGFIEVANLLKEAGASVISIGITENQINADELVSDDVVTDAIESVH